MKPSRLSSGVQAPVRPLACRMTGKGSAIPNLSSIALLAICLLPGCGGSDNPDPAGPGDPTDSGQCPTSSYNLQVGSRTLVGHSGVDTNWDPELRIVFLSTDDVARPTGTVTLTLGPISAGTNGSRRADVVEAFVSTSLKLVGTADETQDEGWRMGTGLHEVTGIRSSDEYIEGTVVVDVEEILPAGSPPGQLPRHSTLTGTFLAVGACL